MSLVEKVEQLKSIDLIHDISTEVKQLVAENKAIKKYDKYIKEKMFSLFATLYLVNTGVSIEEIRKDPIKYKFYGLTYNIRAAFLNNKITWAENDILPYLTYVNTERKMSECQLILNLEDLKEFLDDYMSNQTSEEISKNLYLND